MERGLLALAGLAIALPFRAQTAAPPGAVRVARIAYVQDVVEVRSAGRDWARVLEGAPLRTGDTLRTGPRGAARLDFPWMSVAVSSSTELALPASLVLTARLESGRIEQSTPPGGAILKLTTPEARIRGQGRVAVRREPGRTLVSALSGDFRVEAGGRTVSLAGGQGCVLSAGSAGPAVGLPPAPTELAPGADPRYVRSNQLFSLQFSSSARLHHLQVLGVDGDQPLLESDVGAPPVTLSLPLVGTFRWRVAARDGEGLEGRPSQDGWIVVVER